MPFVLLALAVAGGWGVGPIVVPEGPLPDEPPPAARGAGPVEAAGPGRDAGRIEGSVRLPRRAPRRTASRYPGAAPPGAHPVQELPAVVYLRGSFPGVSPGVSGRAVMAQEDTTFAPPLLVAPVGAAVDFPNRDPFFHNVFSYSSARRFDLGRYPQGQSKEDGAFSLEGVPPGRHTLVAWHADGGTEEVEVQVPDGGTTRVTVDLS